MAPISRRAVIGAAAAVGVSPFIHPFAAFAATGGTPVAFLIKRSGNDEIDITDGVTGRMPLPTPVWQEWVTILGVPAPGYIVVSDALWNALPVIAPPVVPPPTPPPVPPPTPPPTPPPSPTPTSWPTASTTGVPVGTVLVAPPSGWAWRTANAPSSMYTTETIDGQSYRVFTGFRFSSSTAYLGIDSARAAFRKCSFTATGAISNGMSLVQQQSAARSTIFEDCTVDGGPMHNRGVWGDTGDLTIRRCFFTRFGEAAVEKNDRTGVYSMLVEDSFLDEVKGWPSGTHTDGLQMDGGKNFTARHNTINVEPWNDGVSSGASNACIGVWSTLANMVGDILIERNLLAGAGSNLYCEQRGFTMRGAVTIRDNVFDRRRYPTLKNTAAIWFGLYPGGRPSQLVWSGNAFDDGTPLTLAQAIVSNP